MNVLLLQLDGKLPNVALMRIAAHHRDRGEDVTLRRVGRPEHVERALGDGFEHVYASAIFKRSRPLAEHVRRVWPGALIGGTGIDEAATPTAPAVITSLEAVGITTLRQDYSIYPEFRSSIGFTQRGCRLSCEFCVVPTKEGHVRPEQTVAELWRGDPWPRELLLLDNDFFGQPQWRERVAEMRAGGFKVSFSQGINARALTPETAKAAASVDYRDDGMTQRRIYTAWDNRADEGRLFRGLRLLVEHGIKPAHIMVYILLGYWPGETHEDRDYRRARLREFGAFPYPMPYVRTPELVGFQRWVVGAYDKRVSWADWLRAGYRPERLGRTEGPLLEVA